MKFLGNISHLSNSGKLVARSSQSPPSGAFVYDKNKNKIGKVVDVFGPTKQPYISIRLFRSIKANEFEDSNGEDLYVSISTKKNNKNFNKSSKRGSKRNFNKNNSKNSSNNSKNNFNNSNNSNSSNKSSNKNSNRKFNRKSN